MENKTKILFIDREQGEYLLIAEVLSHIRHVEYELVWCDQLDIALNKILSQEFDVALLDYYWGDTSARDLLNAARVQACQTPIVVMTDEMETEVDREAIRAGAADYLIKGQIDHLLLERTLRYASSANKPNNTSPASRITIHLPIFPTAFYSATASNMRLIWPSATTPVLR